MDWRVQDLSLPSEIWDVIFKHLETQHIIRASLVNKISRKCRLFVHTLYYSEDWPHFGQRIATLPNIVNIRARKVDYAEQLQNLTVLKKLQVLSLSKSSNKSPPLLLHNVLQKTTSLRALSVRFFPENFDLVADSCSQITRLTLGANSTDDIMQITAVQKLTQLRMLKLSPGKNSFQAIELTHLQSLTWLELNGPNFDVNIARGDLTALTKLKGIKLRHIQAHAANFGSVSKLPNLEILAVRSIASGPFPNSIFEECLGLSKLTRLEFDNTILRLHRMNEMTQLITLAADIMPDILNHITKLTNLKKLKLMGLVPVGFLSTLSQHMVQLEDLGLYTWKDQNVNDNELMYLSHLDRLTSLTTYSLDCITSAGVSLALCQLTNLESLKISGKGLLAEEMSDLINKPNLKSVEINGAVEKSPN